MLTSEAEVLWTARYDYRSDWRLAKHQHDYFQMIYFLAGTGQLFLEDREHSIQAGDLCLIKPNTVHGLSPESLVKTLDLTFTVRAGSLRHALCDTVDVIDEKGSGIAGIFEHIRWEGEQTNYLYRDICNVFLCQILIHYLRQDRNRAVAAASTRRTRCNRKEYLPFAAQGWNYSQSTGFSNFNALEAQYQRHLSNGLQTLVAFTWEKCLGDSNGGFNAENGSQGAPYEYFFNSHLSKGPCSFDVPFLVSWSTLYELPFGKGKRWLNHGPAAWVLGNWNTNFTFLARSGQNFNPSWGGASNICTTAVTTNCVPTSIAGVAPTSTDPANLSNAGGAIAGYSRPSLVPGCNLTGGQSGSQWYNPACFVSP